MTALQTSPDVTRPDWDTPADAPDDDRRGTVRDWRREIAGWLRAHGIAATGPAWEAATFGERDLTVLRRIAADSGDPAALVRHWSGRVMPAALADGDMTDWGSVVGVPVVDPETGAVWFVARGLDSARTVADVEVRADVAVSVRRGKGARL